MNQPRILRAGIPTTVVANFFEELKARLAVGILDARSEVPDRFGQSAKELEH